MQARTTPTPISWAGRLLYGGLGGIAPRLAAALLIDFGAELADFHTVKLAYVTGWVIASVLAVALGALVAHVALHPREVDFKRAFLIGVSAPAFLLSVASASKAPGLKLGDIPLTIGTAYARSADPAIVPPCTPRENGSPGFWRGFIGVQPPTYEDLCSLSWQEVVAHLARERTLAETCGALLKKYGDKAAQLRGSLTYSEAKAEFDSVIAGLVVTLARRGQPESLFDLQAMLTRGFEKREAFCRSVETIVPNTNGEKGVGETGGGTVKPVPETGGEKGVGETAGPAPIGEPLSKPKGANGIGETVRDIVRVLTDAAVDIWSWRRENDALMHKTIQTQLEATSWPAFSDLGK
jgi:hypothetical protein